MRAAVTSPRQVWTTGETKVECQQVWEGSATSWKSWACVQKQYVPVAPSYKPQTAVLSSEKKKKKEFEASDRLAPITGLGSEQSRDEGGKCQLTSAHIR